MASSGMSDDPLLTCKQCGETLTTDAPNPGPENVMSCPIHGPMGKLGDLVEPAGANVGIPLGLTARANNERRENT